MKVYALYPDFDLSDKKAFIKETVKAVSLYSCATSFLCLSAIYFAFCQWTVIVFRQF